MIEGKEGGLSAVEITVLDPDTLTPKGKVFRWAKVIAISKTRVTLTDYAALDQAEQDGKGYFRFNRTFCRFTGLPFKGSGGTLEDLQTAHAHITAFNPLKEDIDSSGIALENGVILAPSSTANTVKAVLSRIEKVGPSFYY